MKTIGRCHIIFGFTASLFLTCPDRSEAQQLPECVVQKPAEGDLAAGNAAVEKMRTQCLPKIRKIAECTSRARLLSDAVTEFVSRFNRPSANAPLLVTSAAISGSALKDYDLNVWRNFLSLESSYRDSLEAVRQLAKKYETLPSTTQDILRQLDDLSRDYSEVTKTIARLSESEYRLLFWIGNIQSDLFKSAERAKIEILFLTSDECKDAGVSVAVNQIQGAFASFGQDIADVYQHIMEARKARQNLVNYTYTAIRSRIEEAYSVKAAEDLSTLGGKIDTILRASRLSARFENWFTWASFEPNRDKVLTVYQQFEESRKILASDLQNALNFKDQMIVVTEAFPDVAQPYLLRIDSVISDYKRRLDRLESKGWSGYLATQKSSANRIVGNPERLTPECLSQYRNFLNQADSVDTLEEYRISEKRFMNAVIACSREKA